LCGLITFLFTCAHVSPLLATGSAMPDHGGTGRRRHRLLLASPPPKLQRYHGLLEVTDVMPSQPMLRGRRPGHHVHFSSNFLASASDALPSLDPSLVLFSLQNYSASMHVLHSDAPLLDRPPSSAPRGSSCGAFDVSAYCASPAWFPGDSNSLCTSPCTRQVLFSRQWTCASSI
jgi:hypothetical protein